jgi:hypothetical protein
LSVPILVDGDMLKRGVDRLRGPTRGDALPASMPFAALAQLGRLEEARSAVKTGLALNPAFTVSRARAVWTAMSDDPTYLGGDEPIFEGLREAGVPEQ